MSTRRLGPFLVLLIWGPALNHTHAADALRTVVLTGQPAPGATGGAAFSGFAAPTINDSGQVAFFGELSTHLNESWDGIWSMPAVHLISPIAISGQTFTANSAAYTLDQFEAPFINNAGQVDFTAIQVTGDGRGATVLPMIWKVSDAGQRQLIARGGEAAPGAPGISFNGFQVHAVNGRGDLIFMATFTGSIGSRRGLWSYGHDSGVQLVGRDDDSIPSLPSGTTINNINGPITRTHVGLTEARQTAFTATLNPGGSGYQALFLGRNRTDLATVLVTGDPVTMLPGNFKYYCCSEPRIRENGSIAFTAGLNFEVAPFNGDQVLWSTDAAGAPHVVAQNYTDVPWIDGTVKLHSFGRFAAAGESVTAFVAHVFVGPSILAGIWKSDLLTPPTFIAGVGQVAPGTAGTFNGLFYEPVLNDRGQVAFRGVVNFNGGEFEGFWAQDQFGELKLIAIEGQQIDVDDSPNQDLRTIHDVTYTPTRSFFNERGEVVFHAKFTDGTEGIFVSRLVAVPEPCSACLAISLFTIAMGRPSRRRHSQLNHFAYEQADDIGLPVEGPYKPEYYRY